MIKLKKKFKVKINSAVKSPLNIIITVVLLLLVLNSCKRNVGEPIDLKHEYFPTEIGKWVIYDVVDIRHDINHDTFNYQIKEVITADFLDNEGRLAQRVERFVRDSASLPWAIKDVWSSVRTTRTAEKIEEDERFLKMSFPIDFFKSWNGNVYNQQINWEYFFDSIDYQSTVGTFVFDSLVRVNQRTNYNVVEYEKAYEIYAKNIGLVEKILVDLDVRSGFSFDIPPVIDSIIKGNELYQVAIDYGDN